MKNNRNSFKTWYAVSFAIQLGFLTFLPVGGFMLLGYWGDKYFQTNPILLLLGMIIGVLISVYEAYHMLIPLIKPRHD